LKRKERAQDSTSDVFLKESIVILEGGKNREFFFFRQIIFIG